MLFNDYLQQFGYTKNEAKNYLINCLKEPSCITHNGVFHSDDTFSYALLKMYKKNVLKMNEELKVIRTRNIPEDFKGAIFDINRGIFDHHNEKEKSAFREDEVQYSSVGILWNLIGEDLISSYSKDLTKEQSEEIFKSIDNSLIRGIDGEDNGAFRFPEVSFINLMNPTCYEDKKECDNKFKEASTIAGSYLDRSILKEVSLQLSNTEVLEASNQKGDWCYLEKYLPWKKVLVPSDKKIVSWYDSEENNYKAQVVPIDENSFDAKINFPEEWSGKRDAELEEIMGIKDVSFCYKGFLMIANTKEALESAIKKTIELDNEKHLENNKKIDIPEDINYVLETLAKNDKEGYIVGGCVRDSIMKKTPHDFDVTTSALPSETKKMFNKTYNLGEEHGTIVVQTKSEDIEVTTYRTDGVYSDGRHPDTVTFTSDIEEDLKRRDFTMNAIAYNPEKGYIDPFNGRQDIENRVIRCVGNPNERFKEDGLRILRAMRFAATTGFSIEEETKKAMIENKDLLNNISDERISQEISKILQGDNAVSIFRDYHEIFSVVIPELKEMKGFEQNNPHHKYDLWEHTLHSMEQVDTPELKLTMLLHDIGKVDTYSVDEKGVGHFFGHAEVSKEKSEDILKRLKFTSTDYFNADMIKECIDLIGSHDLVLDTSDKKIKKQMVELEGNYEFFEKLLEVKKADINAQALVEEKLPQILEVQEKLSKLKEENPILTLKDMPVKGNDIIERGIKDGKEVGSLLNGLLNDVVSGNIKEGKDDILKSLDKRIENKCNVVKNAVLNNKEQTYNALIKKGYINEEIKELLNEKIEKTKEVKPMHNNETKEITKNIHKNIRESIESLEEVAGKIENKIFQKDIPDNEILRPLADSEILTDYLKELKEISNNNSEKSYIQSENYVDVLQNVAESLAEKDIDGYTREVDAAKFLGDTIGIVNIAKKYEVETPVSDTQIKYIKDLKNFYEEDFNYFNNAIKYPSFEEYVDKNYTIDADISLDKRPVAYISDVSIEFMSDLSSVIKESTEEGNKFIPTFYKISNLVESIDSIDCPFVKNDKNEYVPLKSKETMISDICEKLEQKEKGLSSDFLNSYLEIAERSKDFTLEHITEVKEIQEKITKRNNKNELEKENINNNSLSGNVIS